MSLRRNFKRNGCCVDRRRKHWVPKVNFLNSCISGSACLRLCISYNLILNGRVGQGAFFFRWILVDNIAKMWYDTSCMMSLFVENFGKKCGGFSRIYIRMKVPICEAYRSSIFISVSIYSFNMQCGSCSNIILTLG